MTVILTLIAQVVITLRSVFLGGCGFMLITVEWNRIYAVTRKNLIIASCFGVIMISQSILGLYLTADATGRGCKSVTKYCHDSCRPYYLSVTNPTSDLYDVHLRGTIVRGNRISRHVCRIRYGASLIVHRSFGRHPL